MTDKLDKPSTFTPQDRLVLRLILLFFFCRVANDVTGWIILLLYYPS